MVVPTLGALVYFVLSSDSIIGQITYGIDKLFLLFFPALATYLWFRSPKPAQPHPQPHRKTSLLLGIGSGVAISAVTFALMASPLGELVRAAAPNIAEKANSLGFAQHFLLFAIFLSVVHSAIEEYYWRWFVYRRLDDRSKNPTTAHTIAAVAFAAHHLVILWQFFPPIPAIAFSACVGIGGAIWSVIYRRTGSLIGPWVSHMIVDFALMAIGHQLITSVT
ncbi:MAG: CPBP family intramembrane metalloprotease [Verrucomicrobiales bacterium]|nr:CPBP family intramembrane metalloprotease [Verrucomicrobiales bacterium]